MKERDANLDLTGVRQLQGSFQDQTGAPFDADYVVILRDHTSGHIERSSVLDAMGHFRLDGVYLHRVNLSLVLTRANKIVRTGFEAPIRLRCDGAEDCTLDIVLMAAATDQLKYQCPLGQESR